MQMLKWTIAVCMSLLLTTHNVSCKCFAVQFCRSDCTSDERHTRVCANTDFGLMSMKMCDAKCSQSEIAHNGYCTRDEHNESTRERAMKHPGLECEEARRCRDKESYVICARNELAKKGQCVYETLLANGCPLPCGMKMVHDGECTKEESKKVKKQESET